MTDYGTCRESCQSAMPQPCNFLSSISVAGKCERCLRQFPGYQEDCPAPNRELPSRAQIMKRASWTRHKAKSLKWLGAPRRAWRPKNVSWQELSLPAAHRERVAPRRVVAPPGIAQTKSALQLCSPERSANRGRTSLQWQPRCPADGLARNRKMRARRTRAVTGWSEGRVSRVGGRRRDVLSTGRDRVDRLRRQSR